MCGRLNIVKMSILPQMSYIFNEILSNFQWHFLQKQKKQFCNLYGITKDHE